MSGPGSTCIRTKTGASAPVFAGLRQADSKKKDRLRRSFQTKGEAHRASPFV